jgi:hypothetical protein
MANLFDNLNNINSFKLYYNSDLEALRDAWEESSDKGSYPSDSNKEDPFSSPDKDNPEPI